MKTSYNEACARDCSTLEKDLALCEKAGFDYIEIRLDLLRGWLKEHTVEQLKEFFETHRLKPHAINAVYLYQGMLPDETPDADPKPEPLIIPMDPDIEPDTRMPEEMKAAA